MRRACCSHEDCVDVGVVVEAGDESDSGALVATGSGSDGVSVKVEKDES